MVKSDVISQTAVKDLLCKDEEGKELFRKFTKKQLINRLKYKIRLNHQEFTTSATCLRGNSRAVKPRLNFPPAKFPMVFACHPLLSLLMIQLDKPIRERSPN